MPRAYINIITVLKVIGNLRTLLRDESVLKTMTRTSLSRLYNQKQAKKFYLCLLKPGLLVYYRICTHLLLRLAATNLRHGSYSISSASTRQGKVMLSKRPNLFLNKGGVMESG